MSGVTGLAGAYDVGVRTRPQLIGCALAQEPGVLNFGLRVAVRATADGGAEPSRGS